jgi:hypothetical protein
MPQIGTHRTPTTRELGWGNVLEPRYIGVALGRLSPQKTSDDHDGLSSAGVLVVLFVDEGSTLKVSTYIDSPIEYPIGSSPGTAPTHKMLNPLFFLGVALF